ncbi:SufD family Fe-S cluster assembly protein [Sulfurimonas sp. MAG313]|nr:SufD family Fe-S cluster assembly protein [Sulfurimonas sp. MAG313]MDF1881865.1 SufD family Fe-S cluster assembly protein [Sulfurimonas sp. MAG313]
MFYPLHELLDKAANFTQLPSKKEEKWQHSPLSSYLDKQYQDTRVLAPYISLRDEQNFLEIYDGHLVASHLPSSVIIKEHTVACEIENNPFAFHASSSALHPLELNFFEDTQCSVYLKYSEDGFLSSNLNIIVQKNIKVEIFLVYEGAKNSFISHASHIKLEHNSQLILSEQKSLSPEAIMISQDYFHLHERSKAKIFKLFNEGEYLHAFIQADLQYKSDIDISSLLLTSSKQRYIVSCDINHLADLSLSKVLSKQVLKDKSVTVFDAKTKVFKGTKQTQVHQASHALLLNNSAQAYAKPHLEIFSDDLSASHGSTVGELSIEALGYLISRGITQTKAKEILIQAFIFQCLDVINSKEHKHRIIKHLGYLDE